MQLKSELHLCIQYCLPRDPGSTFLRFPFSDTGIRINDATNGLLLLDHPWFKFKNGRDENLQEIPKGAFKTVEVNIGSYKQMKEDVSSENYSHWFNDEQMDFFFRWMMRNENSPLVQATEIIHTIVTRAVKEFFEKDCCLDMNKGTPTSMKNIHHYLMINTDILMKKFLFLQ